MELNIPAIEGIGGALVYLVDRYGEKGSIWDVDFRWTGVRESAPEGAGLYYIDHLTHNVERGRMDWWANWYKHFFNFRQIRYFDIEGKLTGLHSRAMTSPDGKIRIPINESADEKARSRNIFTTTRARASSISPADAGTFTRRSPPCAARVSTSCPGRPPPTMPGSTSACRATVSLSKS